VIVRKRERDRENGIDQADLLRDRDRDRLSLVTTGSCSLSSFRVSPASDAEVAHSSRHLLTKKERFRDFLGALTTSKIPKFFSGKL
jgi:hypothetical protein